MIHTVLADFNDDNTVAKLNFEPKDGFEFDMDALFFDVRNHSNDYGFTNTKQNSHLVDYIQNKDLMNGLNLVKVNEHKLVLSTKTTEQYFYDLMSADEKQAHDTKKYFDSLRAERMNLKAELNSTDWIVVKIQEQTIACADVDENELLDKYSVQLNERNNARKRINAIEKELTDANESFEIVFEGI